MKGRGGLKGEEGRKGSDASLFARLQPQSPGEGSAAGGEAFVHIDGQPDRDGSDPTRLQFIDEQIDARGFPIVEAPDGRRACWGIAAPGRIAHDFAASVVGMGGQICAVGAGFLPHPEERAAEFARTFGVNRSYGSYEELAADKEVRMVYVATVNSAHYQLAKLFLEAGERCANAPRPCVSGAQVSLRASPFTCRKLAFRRQARAA